MNFNVKSKTKINPETIFFEQQIEFLNNTNWMYNMTDHNTLKSSISIGINNNIKFTEIQENYSTDKANTNNQYFNVKQTKQIPFHSEILNNMNPSRYFK